MTAAGLGARGIRQVWDGLRWYLREIGGENRWAAYVEACGRHGHPPMTRREYERRRAVLAEQGVRSRCC